MSSRMGQPPQSFYAAGTVLWYIPSVVDHDFARGTSGMRLPQLVLLLLWPTAAFAAESGPATKTFTYKQTPQAKLELIVHYPSGWQAGDERGAIVFFFG